MAEAFAETTAETVATKEDLRQESSNLRVEIQALRSELTADMQALRSELTADIRALRSEIQTFRWQTIAAVALMLLVHLGAVWGIVAAHVP
jgi:hypothetical protein